MGSSRVPGSAECASPEPDPPVQQTSPPPPPNRQKRCVCWVFTSKAEYLTDVVSQGAFLTERPDEQRRGLAEAEEQQRAQIRNLRRTKQVLITTTDNLLRIHDSRGPSSLKGNIQTLPRAKVASGCCPACAAPPAHTHTPTPPTDVRICRTATSWLTAGLCLTGTYEAPGPPTTHNY